MGVIVSLRCWGLMALHYLLHPRHIRNEFCHSGRKERKAGGNKEEEDTKNILEKMPVVVITGGRGGIGREAVVKFLCRGFHVIAGLRTEDQAFRDFCKEGSKGKGLLTILQLDLTSLHSVKTFCLQVERETERLDVLICNAGIMFAPFSLTKDGFESHFQVNFLSHFLLTLTLLPLLEKTAKTGKPCRIVNVSSDANFGGKINLRKLGSYKERSYSATKAYCDSKLLQILTSNYLSENLTDIRVLSVHPGIIKTGLWEHLGCWGKFVEPLGCLYRTTEEGAESILEAATSPKYSEMEKTFISSGSPVNPNKQAMDLQFCEQTYKKSFNILHDLKLL